MQLRSSIDIPESASIERPAISLYLDLLKRCLCRVIFPDGRYEGDHETLYSRQFDANLREEGRDWPIEAETMVGMKRLTDLERRCLSVIEQGIPGDFVETGVWRGGCAILMRAVLAVTGDHDRMTWVFDSFQGLPKPDPAAFPADRDLDLWKYQSYLGVGLDKVKANFARYKLLDDRTRFIPGWFRDTIAIAPIDRIAVLRLDGDLYESTWTVLTHLYPKLSPGGFVIIDDYGAIPACRAAVEDFRRDHSVTSPIIEVDWTGITWRK